MQDALAQLFPLYPILGLWTPFVTLLRVVVGHISGIFLEGPHILDGRASLYQVEGLLLQD